MHKNKKLIILFVLIASLSLILSGCATKNGVKIIKCKTDSDCLSSGCKVGKCTDNACSFSYKSDCCGNLKCEKESGENRCKCAADCKNCSGTVPITVAGKTTLSTYLKVGCNAEQECVATYNPSILKEKQSMNEFAGTNFKFNVYTSYNNPFDISLSNFKIEFKLNSIDETKIKTPVTIKEVRIMEGTSNLIARKAEPLNFMMVDETKTIELTPTVQLANPEEAKTVSIQIDYEYTPLITSGGVQTPGKTETKTYKISLTDKITFLDPTIYQP